MLASGQIDGTIGLWDTTTYSEMAAINGHKGMVKCLAFSPNGKLLASGSHDSTVKLWDIPPARQLEEGLRNAAPDQQSRQAQKPDDIIQAGERLVVRVLGTPANEPINGVLKVEASGTLPLGPLYGRVKVEGMNLVDAEQAIGKHLQKLLKEPIVMVTRFDGMAQDAAVDRRLRRLEEELKDLRAAVEKLQGNQ